MFDLVDFSTNSSPGGFAAASLLSVLTASAFSCATALVDARLYWPYFEKWQQRWNVTYDSPENEIIRGEIWADNARRVMNHNRKTTSWSQIINPFADQTSLEFKSKRNGLIPPQYPRPPTLWPPMHASWEIPDSVDWRHHGIVNPIKNQEQCGSCWAFSAVASLEGQYALKNKNLTSFSEQNLVDCVQDVQVQGGLCCDGCEGGLMDAAFEYLAKSQNGKDDLENKYVYTAMDEQCSFAQNGPGLGDVTGYVDLPTGCDHSLAQAVATIGVISVGVDANSDWQMYGGGVYVPDPNQGGCSSDPGALDHGVAVVGYNTDVFNNKTMSYWIVRNSWGRDWGIDGYMYLSRDVQNACGISNYASYPVLRGSARDENQCLNSHPQCPSEVCYTPCPCNCFIPSSVSPCDCSAATCSC